MKHIRWIPRYSTEINELGMECPEALLALYIDAYHDGMYTGRRNTLLGISVVATFVVAGLCIARNTYLDHKKT